MQELANRIASVRVCCGDWKRTCGPSPTFKHGLTGVFLDPPYDHEDRATELYAVDEKSIFTECLEWCKENGANPLLRICLCGYDGPWTSELEAMDWSTVAWKARGGYSSQNSNGNDNPERERMWFSPACLQVEAEQYTLF